MRVGGGEGQPVRAGDIGATGAEMSAAPTSMGNQSGAPSLTPHHTLTCHRCR